MTAELAPIAGESPSVAQWTLGFILVGIAWGFTTPFMRRAAVSHTPSTHISLENAAHGRLVKLVLKGWFAVADLLRRPAYALPFLVNVTGSIWFFLLIGQAELSLTVPITNSVAFLFTVLGEYFAEGKLISKHTWLGMALVLSGIAMCVHSKT